MVTLPASQAPVLSVLLFTPNDPAALDIIRAALRRQTIANQLELVVVVQSAAAFGDVSSLFAGFAGGRVIELDGVYLLGRAKAAAVLAATSPIVVLAEDHCFPEPHWAEKLVAAFSEGPHAAVGPAVRVGNSGEGLGSATHYMHWGAWTEPRRGNAAMIAPHNGAYRRSVLLERAGRLPDLFPTEQFLQAELLDNGHTLFVEPAAVVSHYGISRFLPWVGLGFWGGRLFGGNRAAHERWTARQRLTRVLTAPMVPFVRFIRTIACMRSLGKTNELMRAAPIQFLGLLIHASGEAAGYAFGTGNAELRYSRYELYRHQDLNRRDVEKMRGILHPQRVSSAKGSIPEGAAVTARHAAAAVSDKTVSEARNARRAG